MKLVYLLLGVALAGCTAGATDAGQATGPSRAVAVVDFAYRPGRIIVPLGTTVTWTNYDVFGHTVTAGSQEVREGTFDGALGELADGRGTTFSHRFSHAGTFPYFCDLHPDMKGTVTVVPIEPVSA